MQIMSQFERESVVPRIENIISEEEIVSAADIKSRLWHHGIALTLQRIDMILCILLSAGMVSSTIRDHQIAYTLSGHVAGMRMIQQ